MKLWRTTLWLSIKLICRLTLPICGAQRALEHHLQMYFPNFHRHLLLRPSCKASRLHCWLNRHGFGTQRYQAITAWLLITITCRDACIYTHKRMCTHTHTHTHTHVYAGAIFFIIFKEKNWAVSKSLLTAYKAQVMNVSLIHLRCYLLWMKGFNATWLWQLSAYRNSEEKRKLF